MLGDDKRGPRMAPSETLTPTAFIDFRFVFSKIPVGKIASTNLSCAAIYGIAAAIDMLQTCLLPPQAGKTLHCAESDWSISRFVE